MEPTRRGHSALSIRAVRIAPEQESGLSLSIRSIDPLDIHSSIAWSHSINQHYTYQIQCHGKSEPATPIYQTNQPTPQAPQATSPSYGCRGAQETAPIQTRQRALAKQLRRSRNQRSIPPLLIPAPRVPRKRGRDTPRRCPESSCVRLSSAFPSSPHPLPALLE